MTGSARSYRSRQKVNLPIVLIPIDCLGTRLQRFFTQGWCDAYSDKKGMSQSKVTGQMNWQNLKLFSPELLDHPCLQNHRLPAHSTGNPEEMGKVGQRLNLYLQPVILVVA